MPCVYTDVIPNPSCLVFLNGIHARAIKEEGQARDLTAEAPGGICVFFAFVFLLKNLKKTRIWGNVG